MPPDALIHTPDQIGAEWLGSVLGRPGLELHSSERIGTGQMSQNFRVTFADGGAEETVVVKLASDDATSRGTGVGMGAYYREIAFYENLAGRLGDSVPGYHLAAYDPGEGWFTLVLDDGTHTHAVGVPKMPGFGVGYVQRGDELDEIGAVSLDQQVAGDGLVTADTITSGPEPELELAVRPLAYGPILPEAPDGRVTHFVRAMCDVTAADGRKGTGWVEWNRNQG